MRPSMEGLKTPFFLSTLFFIFIISNATDTITKTQSITGNQTIVSSDGSFEMGFFSPGSSHNFYLGIWYKKISTGTVVWVANRETPLLNSSGVLKVIDPGILVFFADNKNKNSQIIWSTNTIGSTQDPVAQLLESGNLVVKDSSNINNNPEHFLWQSFDYPCNTLLPGMKLGKDFVTGLERHLSSWKSIENLAQGDFTYRCDPQGYPQNILSNGSTELFRTGPWNGLGFSGLPNLKPNSIYTYGLVFNEKEVFYSYQLVNKSVISRFSLNVNGIMQRWTWIDRTKDWGLYLTVPIDNCDNFNLCGPYGSCNVGNSPVCGCLSKFVPKDPTNWGDGDWSNGCVRRTALDCGNGDGFVKLLGFKMPDTRQYSWFNTSMNLMECELMCLRNCSCMAYTSLDIRGDGSGCLLWFGELIDMREFSELQQDIYIRMASSELAQHEDFNGKRERIIVTVAVLVGFFSLGLGLALYYLKKKKDNSQPNREGNPTHNPEQELTDKRQKEDLELPLFDLAVIADSTDNFSINNKLGQGGFGPVYKGVLEGGQEIAVKRLSKSSSQGLDEFKNEVICIAKLQHRNLVRLLGCCIEGEEKLLIYEYLPNKSLDYFIFGIVHLKV